MYTNLDSSLLKVEAAGSFETPIKIYYTTRCHIQNVPGGKVNILGGHGIGHSKQKFVYTHVTYSERFPR
jgi:hypothetical protein